MTVADKKIHICKDVLKALGICKRTLINWEKAGKLPKPKRDAISNYRYYTEADVKKLKKIGKKYVRYSSRSK